MAVAFLFPGQGSQSPAMMHSWAQHSGIRETFAEAETILKFDLWSLIETGPQQQLNTTLYTQPAMFVSAIAIYREWVRSGAALPDQLAGHSLGEYTALCAADALSFSDALSLVCARARAMHDAACHADGMMMAVLGLDENEVRSACALAAEGQVVSIANINAPGQIVIAGYRQAVQAAAERLQKNGARLRPLPVSVASHCALMLPAAEAFWPVLALTRMNTPMIKTLHNVDTKSYSDEAQIKNALYRQLFEPVRWVESIQKMGETGVTLFVECGPGTVLQNLNKRILPHARHKALSDPGSMEALMNTIAQYGAS